MKPLMIAILLGLIAAAAQAQTPPSDLAPIIMAANAGVHLEDTDPQIKKDNALEASPGVPSEVEDPIQTAVVSSARAQIEENATRKVEPRFLCRGAEPFWIMKIEQAGVEFDLAGEALSKYSTPNAVISENSALAVTNFIAKSQTGAGEMSAIIVESSRSTGISCRVDNAEQPYTHSVFITRNGKVFDGCCWMER